MKIDVITSCNLEQWKIYGERMVSSFLKYWPDDIKLHFYNEDMPLDTFPDDVVVHPFPEWHGIFKRRHRDNQDAHGRDFRQNRPRCPDYDFRRDCVRFSHKVAALVQHAGHSSADLIVWMDADTVTTAMISEDWIKGLFPVPKGYIAWLDRRKSYPECGFFILRASHPAHGSFIERIRHLYQSDKVLGMSETHDSYVIEQVILGLMREDLILPPHSLSGPAGYQTGDPFSHSTLAARLKHLKGKKKYESA